MDGPAVLSMPPLTPSQKPAQTPQPQPHSKPDQVTQEAENIEIIRISENYTSTSKQREIIKQKHESALKLSSFDCTKLSFIIAPRPCILLVILVTDKSKSQIV